jgi:ethanolaminephosphotransferase
VSLYSFFGRGDNGGSVMQMYLAIWMILFTFLISHWEKYNTGVLFLPWSYDIAQIVSSEIQITIIFFLRAEFPIFFCFQVSDGFVFVGVLFWTRNLHSNIRL